MLMGPLVQQEMLDLLEIQDKVEQDLLAMLGLLGLQETQATRVYKVRKAGQEFKVLQEMLAQQEIQAHLVQLEFLGQQEMSVLLE